MHNSKTTIEMNILRVTKIIEINEKMNYLIIGILSFTSTAFVSSFWGRLGKEYDLLGLDESTRISLFTSSASRDFVEETRLSSAARADLGELGALWTSFSSTLIF